MRQPSYSGILWLVLIMALAMSCSHSYQTTSPDGSLKLTVNIKDGKASYAVAKDSRQVIVNSALGFVLANDDNFNSNFKVTGVLKETHDDTWEQPWGEDQYVRNNYNELKLCLQEKDGLKRRMDIVFRLFDDGLGFRYEIPGQENIKDFIVMDETTEFNMPFNNKAWWIPAYRPNRYEYLYSHTLLSKMDTVHTPLTIETRDGLFMTIHEAALYDYGSMTIARRDTSILKCDITPLSDGTKAHLKTPFNTPWRTVIVAREPAKLIESRMMLNLNEPSKIADMSWIKPTKFMGIWWGMFTDVFTWSQGPKHGATTKNAIKYIDYCAQFHIPALLIEGWNYGWDGDWVANGRGFLYTKPYPDFDIKKICDYAKSKGVNIIGHHETGGATINYENQLDSAFAFYENL
ncbi:MAG TPA: glycoside hydrolase family 97 N-terminal domain-containing protein, partial [Bacteroidales bacterium]|nr:glycoside hydrolase family 97 N-terminal domain-containing protein [Bacteroidales bacterium]